MISLGPRAYLYIPLHPDPTTLATGLSAFVIVKLFPSRQHPLVETRLQISNHKDRK